MRVLIAPDKFKGSLSAAEVAEALAAGMQRPGVTVDLCPIADGGEGTVAAAVRAGFDLVPALVTGPTGQPVAAGHARRGTTAVLELATASGLGQLPGAVPAPLTATSRGTGELIAAALAGGAARIVLGVGGSASTDGGAGMLQALGLRLFDRAGHELPAGGAALRQLEGINTSGLLAGLSGAELVIACDVDNPLLGEHGAAPVYGPQKGATPPDVAVLEAGLTRWADVVALTTGRDLRAQPGAGAAGGVAFGAMALLGATLRSGIELVLELVDFDSRLDGVDLVVTGEGALDRQSLRGKGTTGVAAAAARRDVPTVAVAGRVELDADDLSRAGLRAAYALSDREPDRARSMAGAYDLLVAVGRDLADEWVPR